MTGWKGFQGTHVFPSIPCRRACDKNMFIRCGRVALERAYSIPRVELKRKLNTGDATSDADRNIGLTSGLGRDVVSFRMHWHSTLRTEKQRKEVEDRNKQVTGCSAEAPNSGPKGVHSVLLELTSLLHLRVLSQSPSGFRWYNIPLTIVRRLAKSLSSPAHWISPCLLRTDLAQMMYTMMQ